MLQIVALPVAEIDSAPGPKYSTIALDPLRTEPSLIAATAAVDETARLCTTTPPTELKPVLVGPLTYLWLGKTRGETFDKLSLLDRLLPVYADQILHVGPIGFGWLRAAPSIGAFATPEELVRILRQAGFSDISPNRLTFGSVILYTAVST